MMNQIGFHFVGGFSEAEVNTYFGLLNDMRPACINVLGGTQYKEALSFATRAKQAFPLMRVIFRHYRDGGDDGMWTRLSAKDWWEKIGRLYVGTGLTILSDNESMRDDLTPYAAWQAEVMERAGAAGVGIAYGRFSTHNPPLSKVQHLERMLVTAFKYGALHTYSPNTYWSADNTDGFSHLNNVTAYARKLGITLDVTLGEFARLRDIRDAHNGWRKCGISGRDYALDLVAKARTYLPGVPVSVFAVGKWPIGADTFSLDKEALDTLKANPISLEPPIVPPAPPETPAGTVLVRVDALQQLARQLDELTTLIDEENQRSQAITLKLADANTTVTDLLP